EGLLPANRLSVLYGPPGSGKSFLALDWAYHVALGRPWLGRAVQGGPVIYIAAEGTEGLPVRRAAWRQYHELLDPDLLPNLAFVPDTVSLMDRSMNAFIEDVRRRFPQPPVLLIGDILNYLMHGGDEDSSRDMGIAVQAVEAFRRAFGCAVLLLHHTGKKGEL